MTQHERILELCRDGLWVCQGDFWRISKSPHKRRDDIARGRYRGGEPGRHRWEEEFDRVFPLLDGLRYSKSGYAIKSVAPPVTPES